MNTRRATVEVCPDAAGQQPPGPIASTVRVVDAEKWYGAAVGGCFSHVLKCSDGQSYLVKGKHNPQGSRILANELLANRVLQRLDIKTPEAAVVHISEQFIQKNRAMQTNLRSIGPWTPGLAYGSRVSAWGWPSLAACPMFDRIPDRLLTRVDNLQDFANVLLFDAWANQRDSRQALFVRRKCGQHLTAYMIDNGLCFGGSNWVFEAFDPIYIYSQPKVYDSVLGHDAFDSIISKFTRRISLQSLREDASNIPPEWFGNDVAALHMLLGTLDSRTSKLRIFINALRNCKSHPFPSWFDHDRSQPRLALESIHRAIFEGKCMETEAAQ